jgi:D-alanyl-D-alanine carboxypeptidase
VLAAVLLASAAGLAMAGLAMAGPAAAGTGAVSRAGPNPSQLRQEVDAIRDSGAVGVLAEVTTPRGRDSARAGTAAIGTGRPVPLDAE